MSIIIKCMYYVMLVMLIFFSRMLMVLGGSSLGLALHRDHHPYRDNKTHKTIGKMRKKTWLFNVNR